MTHSEIATVRLRQIRLGLAGMLILVAALGAAPAQPAPTDPRTKEIQELETKLAQLQQKLATLKADDPTKGKQPLQLKDLTSWRSLGRSVLSRDGKWFAVGQQGMEGKAEVIARQTQGDKVHSFKDLEGYGSINFSADSKWVAFSVVPRRPSSRPQPGAAPAPPTSGKVVLVQLETGEKTEFEGVTRFAFSGPQTAYLALHRSPPAPTMSALSMLAGAAGAGAAPPSRSRGSDLVLRELTTGKELTLGNVAEFAFDREGLTLALVLDTQNQTSNGVQLRHLKTSALHQLDSGKATYEGLTWTEKGDGFTLLKGVEDKAFKDKRYSLLVCTDPTSASPSVAVLDPTADKAFPKDMLVSAARKPSLSDDLGTVFFGIHEAKKADAPTKGPNPAKPGDRKAEMMKALAEAKSKLEKAEPEKPDLVIWHGSDPRLQSQQEKDASTDRQFSYLCAYRLKDKKFLRLADEALRTVSVAPKQKFAIGLDRRTYERIGSLNGQRIQDVYVVDLQTGERHLALKQNRYTMGTSPDGTRLLFYDDGQYHVYDLATRKSRVITKGVPTSFINTEDDHNVDRPPTPAEGWTSDGSAVLLSDGWDLWKVPVADGQAVNWTGNGKKDGIRYQSRVTLDPEEKGADLQKPQIVTMYGEWTKKGGLLRLEPNGTKTILAWDDAHFGNVARARDAEVYVHTRETVSEYPDYHATDASFKNPRRLTQANPEQDRTLWSSGSQLVNYESVKGDKLQAALLLPANYEKGKKYPTIVYIYEKLSQQKNRYLMPRPMGFNAAYYTSNGYAVLLPDIRYTINDPGMSAVWCVLPALEAAAATGVVDRDRVGLHGHSWGGYQTAFLITQTPIFKAAVAGAPLTNLISMYSSIYWNVGIANQPIFESSQGRFTGGYWDQQEAFIRNSPVFHAKNVKTPLILLHNDKDGAVDFNQGIEYFNTLRRLDRPVVMLQYRGENHGLAKLANQKDYSVRMREFFDHHLLGKPAPAWLKDGVPHLKMDEHLKERSSNLE
ncbi:MAG: prolyl oligopeptidase family serine peptidase [Gemmataceae bacterium]